MNPHNGQKHRVGRGYIDPRQVRGSIAQQIPALRSEIFGYFGSPPSSDKPLMQLNSTLTCPKCGHQSVETMPTDACQFFYDCKGCGERLKPLAGDCCVFCSYEIGPCPPIQ